MAHSDLLKVQDNIFINLGNVAYVEFTPKGAADIHFVGKRKPLRLKRGEVGSLHRYIAQHRNVRRIDEAA